MANIVLMEIERELCCNGYFLCGRRQWMRMRDASHRPQGLEQWKQKEGSFSPLFFSFDLTSLALGSYIVPVGTTLVYNDKKKTQVEMLRCRGGRGWKLLLTKMRKNFFRLLASNGYPFTWRKYLFWHKYSWVLHTFLFECMYARIYILWSKNNDCWIT